MKKSLITLFIILSAIQFSSSQNINPIIDKKAKEILPKVIEWRRHFHEHPELSNREFETSKYVAEYLKSLGLQVQTGVAKTGVVAILRGGKPGPCIALRADMDALPLTEITPVAFASQVKSIFNGDSVGVMHACGHDAHTAILMGTAAVLSSMKKEVHGTVKFIFQPAEEGAPEGEEGGAELMVKEGVLENPHVDMIFGLHMNPKQESGSINYKSGAFQAASDWFTIKVIGKGSHGSQPWAGVDPVVISAQIIQGLQTIVSRQEELTKAPVVITVGKIQGGVRSNIIPDEVVMDGTIRTLDKGMQQEVHDKIRRTATQIAAASGATVEVTFLTRTLVNYNHPLLVTQSLPFIKAAAGAEHVQEINWSTTAEDFSYYGEHTPSFYFFLGGLAPGKDPSTVSSWHTPDFYIDEGSLDVGVKVFCYLVMGNGKSDVPGKNRSGNY